MTDDELKKAIAEYRRVSAEWFLITRAKAEATDRLLSALQNRIVPDETDAKSPAPANDLDRAAARRELTAQGFTVRPK